MGRQIIRILFLSAVLLHCLFPASALALPRRPSLSKNLFRPMTTPAAAASLRGGGEDASKNKKKKKDDDKTVEEIHDEALTNLSNCYRMAFAAGVLGTAHLVWESYTRTQTFGVFNIAERSELSFGLYNFVFGAGWFRVFQLFSQAQDKTDRMSPPKLLQLSNVIGRLWLGATALFSLNGIYLASQQMKQEPLVARIFAGLFATNLAVGQWWHRRALKKEGAPPEPASDYVPARTAGLSASRNMVWAVGSILLFGLWELVETTVQFQKATEGKIGIAVNALLEQSEVVVIAGLLATLCNSFLRAVLQVTKRTFNDKDPAYKEYYQAQSKFYGKITSYIGFQLFFLVLGYVAAIFT